VGERKIRNLATGAESDLELAALGTPIGLEGEVCLLGYDPKTGGLDKKEKPNLIGPPTATEGS